SRTPRPHALRVCPTAEPVTERRSPSGPLRSGTGVVSQARMRRRRVQARLVLTTLGAAARPLVVDPDDRELRALAAVLRLVLALHDGERLHYVVDVITRDAVEVEIDGVQFCAQPKAAFVIPRKAGTTPLV